MWWLLNDCFWEHNVIIMCFFFLSHKICSQFYISVNANKILASGIIYWILHAFYFFQEISWALVKICETDEYDAIPKSWLEPNAKKCIYPDPDCHSKKELESLAKGGARPMDLKGWLHYNVEVIVPSYCKCP